MPETQDKVRLFGALVVQSVRYIDVPANMQDLLAEVRAEVSNDRDLETQQYELWDELDHPYFTIGSDNDAKAD